MHSPSKIPKKSTNKIRVHLHLIFLESPTLVSTLTQSRVNWTCPSTTIISKRLFCCRSSSSSFFPFWPPEQRSAHTKAEAERERLCQILICSKWHPLWRRRVSQALPSCQCIFRALRSPICLEAMNNERVLYTVRKCEWTTPGSVTMTQRYHWENF